MDLRLAPAPSPLGCCVQGDVVVGLPKWVVLPMVLPFVHAFSMYGVALWFGWTRLLHPLCGRGVAGGGPLAFRTGPLLRLTGLTIYWDYTTYVRLVSLTYGSLDFYSSSLPYPGAFVASNLGSFLQVNVVNRTKSDIQVGFSDDM